MKTNCDNMLQIISSKYDGNLIFIGFKIDANVFPNKTQKEIPKNKYFVIVQFNFRTNVN